jgi:hypothetical protein
VLEERAERGGSADGCQGMGRLTMGKHDLALLVQRWPCWASWAYLARLLGLAVVF